MFTKQKLIIKILCASCFIMPFAIIFGQDHILYLSLGSYGFYLLVNIISYLTIGKSSWMKNVLNAFDGLLVLSAVAMFIIIGVLAMDGGEAIYLIIFIPIPAGILFLGILGLFFTNSKPENVKKDGIE